MALAQFLEAGTEPRICHTTDAAADLALPTGRTADGAARGCPDIFGSPPAGTWSRRGAGSRTAAARPLPPNGMSPRTRTRGGDEGQRGLGVKAIASSRKGRRNAAARRVQDAPFRWPGIPCRTGNDRLLPAYLSFDRCCTGTRQKGCDSGSAGWGQEMDSLTGGAGPPSIPPPPYQLRGIEFVQIGVAFDAAAIAPLLPAGVVMVEGVTGGFYCYSAPAGWGIAPYTACLVFVDVEGHDSADGSNGRAVLAGFYSERAEVALRRYIRLPVLPGGARLHSEGDRTVAHGLRGDREVIRLVVEKEQPASEFRSGVHHYLGSIDGTTISAMPVAFSLPFSPATAVSVDVLADDPNLRRLVPTRLIWGGHHRDASITLGAPSQLPVPPDVIAAGETRVGVLSVLGDLGKAGFLVDRTGRVLFANDVARNLLGDGISISHDRLRADLREDQKALDALIDAAVNYGVQSPSLRPVAIRRQNSQSPLIVRSIAIGSRRPGERSPATDVAILVTDPDRKNRAPSQQTLQLLGLTPAEARMACLVGSGVAPREAADRLGNTERTVRFMLSKVFDKLNISRQSELATLVAQLSEVDAE